MSVLAGITANLFQRTRDGRRVYALQQPFGRFRAWYLIADSDASRVEKRFQRFYVLTLTVIIPAAVVLATVSLWLALVLPLVWAPAAVRLWILRGVPRTEVDEGALVPVEPAEAGLSQAQKIGQLWLGFALVAAVLMGGLSVSVLLTGKAWWAVFGVLLFGALTVDMGRQILRVRRAR
jgi:hypothetical protein